MTLVLVKSVGRITSLQHDEHTLYSPEELIAMILQHATKIAEDFSEQKVRIFLSDILPFNSSVEYISVHDGEPDQSKSHKDLLSFLVMILPLIFSTFRTCENI